MKDVDLAYLAGLIDGEGCFTIEVNSRSGSYIPTLQITMSDRAPLDWMAKVVGVRVGRAYRGMTRPTHRLQYKVRVSGRRLVELCVLMRPYMKVKHKHAELVCRFGETIVPRGTKLTPITIQARQQMKQLMKGFNNPPFQSTVIERRPKGVIR